MSDPIETPAQKPAVRKGQHKADCACGWCKKTAENRAKKNSVKTTVSPAAPPSSDASSTPTESSATSSPVKSPPRASAKTSSASGGGTMKQKVAAMAKERTGTAPAQPANDPAPEPEKKPGWWERLLGTKWETVISV